MRKTPGSSFHVEGWHPLWAAAVGSLIAVAITVLVLLILVVVAADALRASWAFPVIVTALGAGGAAGLTIKNLNLKRAESRRETNLMFDSQFETGARLLGGGSESEIVAGSLLLGSLLRESHRHSQASADLICAALRELRPPNLPPGVYETLEDSGDETFLAVLSVLNRKRNAITRAIQRALAREGAPHHLRGIRWDFSGLTFGDCADLSGALFGAGTSFVRCHFSGEARLRAAEFVSRCTFEFVKSRDGIDLSGAVAHGGLGFYDCNLGSARKPTVIGLWLEQTHIAGLDVRDVTSQGGFNADDADINGDFRMLDSAFRNVSFIDARGASRVDLGHVTAEDYICLRRFESRKNVNISGCTAGGELEVTGARIGGRVLIDACSYSELIEGDPRN